MSSIENAKLNNSSCDPSSCLIIKAQLGCEIRKVPIVNDEITYDELLIMMQRIFKGRLHASDDVTIKYRDEDEDLITIKDSNDISFAVATSGSRVLKLNLLLNEKPEHISNVELAAFKNELKKMRDFSTHMLDRLGGVDSTKTTGITGAELANGDFEAITEKSKETASVPPTVLKSSLAQSVPFKEVSLSSRNAEFDPLHQKRHEHQDEQRFEYETDSKRETETSHVNGPSAPAKPFSEQQEYKTMGGKYPPAPAARESRPDTPNSIDSSRSASQKLQENLPPQQTYCYSQQQQTQYQPAPQQQENVAMIQPSQHQQINAPPLSQIGAVGPQPPHPSVTASYMPPHSTVAPSHGAPPPAPFGAYGQATAPPQHPAHQQSQPPFQQAARPAATPAQSYYNPPGQQQAPQYQQQAQYQQQQQHYGQQGFAPPPTSTTPGPVMTSSASVPPYGGVAGAYAPPPASQVGPPPMGGGPPQVGGHGQGVNPFARVSQSPYVRPATFAGGQQQPSQY